MARPTPKDNARRAMFGWLTDKTIDKWAPATEADLPVEVQSLIAYRNSESEEAQALIAGGLDNVRWDLLSDAAKGPMVWAALARKMGPQALPMNLNTLLRHDVLNVAFHSVKDADSKRNFCGAKDDYMVDYVAGRIADESEIRRGKQFPYQYFAAYLNVDDNVPQKIKTALHKTAEIAVAALFAAAILRRNSDSVVIPFDTSAYDAKIDPNDSILSIAERLAK